MTGEQDPAPQIERLLSERDQAFAENQALGGMLEKLNDQVYTFYNISRTIASTNDLPAMISAIVVTLEKSISFDRVTFYLTNEDRSCLKLLYAKGLTVSKGMTIKLGEGLPGRIVQNGEHQHIHDLARIPQASYGFLHYPGEEQREGSYIGIALKSSDGAAIGVISLDTKHSQGLGVEEMDFLALTSQQISAGIEKCSLFRKTAQLSRTDGLTGLFNRRVFDEVLLQEMTRRIRTRKPLGLIMLDIDHFKRFNDTFGHQEGDQALRELAACIKGQCRHETIDICCRYGGEEFAVILPEEGLPSTLMIAERIRKAVEQHPFSVKHAHPGTTVTVSLGVAVAEAAEKVAPEEILKRADEALYASKRNGRNRVSH